MVSLLNPVTMTADTADVFHVPVPGATLQTVILLNSHSSL